MKPMNLKWMTIIASALMLVMAISCTKPDNTGNDDEQPPHLTPPSEDVEVEVSYDKGEGVIRLLSYNVGAFSKEKASSIAMIARLIKELDADIVGMNEVDSCTTRTGKVYQAKSLADMLGWHHYYGRAMSYQGGAYGNAIVMSKDFQNKGHDLITIPKGSGSEQRSCAVMKNEKFVYMATHLDVKNEESRLSGVRLITDWAKKNYGDSDTPVFLCGDMNCEPNDAPIKLLQQDWTLLSVTKNTYSAISPKKCIDFIFVYNNKAKYEKVASDVPTVFKEADVTVASDHLPVYVDVKLK